jgi:hypothetical protein
MALVLTVAQRASWSEPLRVISKRARSARLIGSGSFKRPQHGGAANASTMRW